METSQDPSSSPSNSSSDQTPESRSDPVAAPSDREPAPTDNVAERTPPKRAGNNESNHPDVPSTSQGRRDERNHISIKLVVVMLLGVLVIGVLLLAVGAYWQKIQGDTWLALFLRETGAVLVVVAVLHAVYEIAIHTVLHSDIDRLGESVEALQKSVDIEKGAVKSGLEAVFSSRDEVNKAIGEEIQGIPPNGKLRVLGISMGALLCPHGALHGTFRELLARKDVTIEVLILDIESVEAVKRAQLEEPREFAWMPEGGEPRYFFETTRCHNELKTATDFVQDIAERCFFREKSARDQLPKEIQKKLLDAPNEPQVNAHFSYRVYDAAPLCYLVIFEDCLFLENYHNAGRGGESPVLKVVHFRGHSSEPTSLFQIYESHFNVMYQQSKDKTKDKRQERMSRFEKPETNSATN